MGGQPRYTMTIVPIYFTHSKIYENCVATKSFALKCIVLTKIQDNKDDASKEVNHVFTLTSDISKIKDKEIILKLEEPIEGASQFALYKVTMPE